MFFKEKSPNVRKKIYYTLKITEQEYNDLRSYLKTNKIPYKKRFKLRYRISSNTIKALFLVVVLIILGILFIKEMKY